MKHRKYTNFYDKKWDPQEKIEKEESKLLLSCAHCDKLHLLPDLNTDYFCDCGNHMVEHVMHKTHIKQCNIKAKELEFKV